MHDQDHIAAYSNCVEPGVEIALVAPLTRQPKALGLSIAAALLTCADEVIEQRATTAFGTSRTLGNDLQVAPKRMSFRSLSPFAILWLRCLERPVHAAQQPPDAKRDRGGHIGLSFDGVANRLLE